MDPIRASSDDLARIRSAAFDHGVVVHYHEIGLKKRNRGFFERMLVRNMQSALKDCEHGGVEVLSGRLVVHVAPDSAAPVIERVAGVFGVASCSPALIAESEISSMRTAALELLANRSFDTFAIAARRATKDHPFNSRQINVELGAAVQAKMHKGVNLGTPDVTIHIEVVGPRAFVYTDRVAGPGGLPVGVSGKVVSLLSGGIDSPVATYRVLRRGAKAILCHFHSAPFTDRSSARKAMELAGAVAGWQGNTTLYVVPLGDAQQEIVLAAPPELRVVLYRRLMARIAVVLASTEGAKAIVLGDSLGQVASQTLENIACVDDASELPVLRPLIGEDKQAIVAEAKRIGTYGTSILPFEDCCSLFVPRSPATRASIEDCRAAEAQLDVEKLVRSCVERAEVERIRP
ncbi:MAG TPA: tRNA uracil 4-sulfurtransferase ThiI [Actinomycetota bacterium]|jgi:thiamine biosynthesis protein ThiI|nr:tRNA uracil 4-sulfurtransferase ThiI [Actinomycetota bacterium]